MFKAMDRRNDTHLKGRKLDLYCINFIKYHRKAMRLEKEIKMKEEKNKRFAYERNSLSLAREVMNSLETDAIIEPCPGCPNCNGSDECFQVTVYK